jgi:hypothetical protein
MYAMSGLIVDLCATLMPGLPFPIILAIRLPKIIKVALAAECSIRLYNLLMGSMSLHGMKTA